MKSNDRTIKAFEKEVVHNPAAYKSPEKEDKQVRPNKKIKENSVSQQKEDQEVWVRLENMEQ